MMLCRRGSIVLLGLFALGWANAAVGQASTQWFFQHQGPAKANAAPAVQMRPLDLDERLLARDVFQQLIETDTTHSTGNTTTAAEAMRQRLLQAGFSGTDAVIVGPTSNRMNLVVRYRGSGVGESAQKPILFIGHLDVVEARRDEWAMDPFKLTETDGYFYGRGTLDMKNSDAAFITSFLLLKKSGWVPKRDIILALTADEEGGGNNGVSWLLEHRRDLVDAEFAVNPDAGGLLLRDGKPAELDLQQTEKVYADFVLTSINPGGHSSRPMPENAIYLVAGALGRVERSPFPVELNAVTRIYLEAEARHESDEKRALISKVLGPKEDAAKEAAQKLAALDPGYNAILRTTCVATMMSAGEAENALPALATANVNCRILPGHSPEEVRKQLVMAVADLRVKVQYRGEGGGLSDVAPEKASMVVPKLTPEIMKPLRAVTMAMWPGVQVVPEMESGSSDSVYASVAGIPTYGFSGMGIDANDDRAHGRDERLRVSSFYDGVEFMKEMVRELGEE
jgi:acetylornithine deacetylase/succinyl-diaminopimelate desuccinylase-like protein